MHCGIWRQPGHKRTTCPILNDGQTNNDDAGQTNNADNHVNEGEQGYPNQEKFDYNGDAENENHIIEKPTQKMGERRPKLPLRKKGLPGIVIREPTYATSTQDVSKGKMVVEETSKGKTMNKSQTNRLERPFWMQNKNKRLASKEGLGTIFMPTPGFVQGNHQPNGTPGVGTPPFPSVSRGQSSKPVEDVSTNDDFESNDEAVEESNEEVEGAPPRRSTRLTMKKSFKFSNTPDTPVDLDES
ncbi:hypothetical protein POM88_017774 [Heracleum sosnowskyi]|uniref:Uncharacterized protein n=1 Tax=Heracleum sosnowskyi TaxID=360622 RepID=A0AAD8MYH4_9APIA|nr:hypothetical protein POM88_017774 [Heracleum sosnowskyi]